MHQLRALLTLRLLLLLALLALAGLVVLWLLRTSGAALSPEAIRALLADLGPWAPAALVAALAAVLVVPAVPATLLQIGAGLAFGPLLGLLYITVADLLGATIGFWLARRWGHRLLDRFLAPATGARLERLAARISWRGVMLLRLLPGPAYPLVSFAAGYSPLSFTSYTLASLGGVLPSLTLLALAGDLVTSSPLLAFAIVAALVGGLALAARLLRLPESEP